MKDPFPIAAHAERDLDRRRFLCAAGAAAALVLSGELAGRQLETARPEPGPIDAASVADLPVGGARALRPDGGAGAVAGRPGSDAVARPPRDDEVLAVRLDADTVVAFDRRCPHLGCPVLWAAERGRFECPCHHAAFDARTGAVLFGPPRRGLTPVEVRSV